MVKTTKETCISACLGARWRPSPAPLPGIGSLRGIEHLRREIELFQQEIKVREAKKWHCLLWEELRFSGKIQALPTRHLCCRRERQKGDGGVERWACSGALMGWVDSLFFFTP